jgi:hypothetical protein
MAYQKLQSSRAAVVTPDDNSNIPSVSSQDGSGNNGCVLYVGGSGNLRVLTAGGDDVLIPNVQGGTFLPLQVKKVFSTNTTATGIIALW